MESMRLDPALMKSLDNLAFLMRERMLVGGISVEKTLSNAHPELPPKFQAEVVVILDALHMATHPQLAKQVDQKRVERAVEILTKRIQRMNRWRDRQRKVLDVSVNVVWNLILLVIILTFLLLLLGLV